MANFTINIIKKDVLDEVSMSSAYLGSKSQDIAAYDRVALIEANKEQLERFWKECCGVATGALSAWVKSEVVSDTEYTLVLSPSEAWNTAMAGGVKSSLTGYLVNGILAKWLMITAPASVEGYAKLAAAQLADAEKKLHRFNKPER